MPLFCRAAPCDLKDTGVSVITSPISFGQLPGRPGPGRVPGHSASFETIDTRLISSETSVDGDEMADGGGGGKKKKRLFFFRKNKSKASHRK